jgi:PAS domain S-box-containing protein
MDKTLNGFSGLRHGVPLAILLVGVLTTAVTHYTDPAGNAARMQAADFRIRGHARVVAGVTRRHLDAEKPAQMQAELNQLRDELGIDSLLFVDIDGTVLAAHQPGWVGLPFNDVISSLPNIGKGLVVRFDPAEQPSLDPSVVVSADQQFIDGIFPIPAREPEANRPLGRLLIREALIPTDGTALVDWQRAALIVTPSALLSLGLYFVYRRRLRRRTMHLQDAMGRFASGDLSVRIRDGKRDELGWIATAFNELAEEVAGTILLLRRRTSRLDDVFDGLPELLFIVHEDGSILEQRGGGVKNLSDSPRDFIGRKITEILPRHLKNILTRAIQDAVLGNQTSTVQYSLDLPAGQVHFEAQLRPVRDDQVVVLIRNISERLRLERTASVRDEFLGLAERHGRTGSWYWELGSDEGICSAGTMQLLGILDGGHVLTYEKFISMVHFEDADAVERLIRSVIAGKEARNMSFRVLTPNGGVRRLYCTMEIQSGAAGSVTALHGTLMDLTDLLIIEEELEAFFTGVPDFLCIAGADGKIHRGNPAFAEFCGCSVSELSGRAVCSVFHADDIASAKSAFEHVLAGGEPATVELRNGVSAGEASRGEWRFLAVGSRDRVCLLGRKRVERQALVKAQVVELHPAAVSEPVLPVRTADIVTPALVQQSALSWRYDLKAERISWDEAAYGLFGIERSEFNATLQAFLGLFAATSCRKDLVLAMHRCMEHGMPFDLELTASRAMGDRVCVRVTGRQERNAGDAVVVAGTITRLGEQDLGPRVGRSETDEVSEPELRVVEGVMTQSDRPPRADDLSRLVQDLRQATSAHATVLVILDPARSQIADVVSDRLPDSYLRELLEADLEHADGVCISAALCGETVLVSNIADDAVYLHFRTAALDAGLGAAAAVPVNDGGVDSAGALGLYYEGARSISADDLEILQRMARAVSERLTRTRALNPRTAGHQTIAATLRRRASETETPAASLVVDLNGTVLTAAGASEFGYSESELVGQPLSNLVAGDSISQFIRALERASIGDAWVGQFLMRTKQGEGARVVMRCTPGVMNGRPILTLSQQPDASVSNSGLEPGTGGAAIEGGTPAEGPDRFRAFISKRLNSSTIVHDLGGR